MCLPFPSRGKLREKLPAWDCLYASSKIMIFQMIGLIGLRACPPFTRNVKTCYDVFCALILGLIYCQRIVQNIFINVFKKRLSLYQSVVRDTRM